MTIAILCMKSDKKIKRKVVIGFSSATKVRKQGIRFWDERTLWHENL